MRVLGVDPGAVSGAYALIVEIRGGVVDPIADDIPIVDRQVNAAEWSRIVARLKPDVAVVEQVGSMPKQGVASTFKFGMGCGLICRTSATPRGRRETWRAPRYTKAP